MEKSVSLWFFCSYLLALTVSLTSKTDPCLAINHLVLNEVTRSTGYQSQSDDDLLCDSHLKHGWYRFQNGAGDMLPTKCPDRLSCGTVVPVWMNGTHPAVTDGVVDKVACANFDDNSGRKCCERALDIQVKNCSTYYVYYLAPTPSCSIAFCAGDKIPCPAGHSSDTGFMPCRRDVHPPVGPPNLIGPIITPDGNSFEFHCVINSSQFHSDNRFLVIWKFNGRNHPNVPAQVVNDSSRFVTLDGKQLKGRLNKNIWCKVKAFYAGHEVNQSDWKDSPKYYSGLKVDPPQLYISEADPVKTLKMRLTVPILCENKTNCCLMLNMAASRHQELTARQTCSYKMCKSHWDPAMRKAEIDIPVLATRDVVREGRTRSLLTFDKLLPVGLGEYAEIFAGLTPAKIPVVEDDTRVFTCVISGDPHIHQVDNKKIIELFELGTYTAYRSTSRHFEVQVRTYSCTWRRVSCVCGVVVREDNDVIRVDQCDQPKIKGRVSPIVSVANQLHPGTEIKRSPDGKNVEILLSLGSSIHINSGYNNMAVSLTTPGTDRAAAEGLCGTTDGIRSNDLTESSGVVDLPCSSNRCRPRPFLRSWRKPFHSSMFDEVPAQVSLPPEHKSTFCTCAINRSVTRPQGHCSYRKHISRAIEKCRNCRNITNRIKPAKWGRVTKREAPSFEDVDVPDGQYIESNETVPDLHLTFPNDQGLTQADANTACLTELKLSPLWKKCQLEYEMISSVLGDCMADLLVSGSTDFIQSAATAFTDLCQAKLVQDPANYDNNTDGELTLKAEFSSELCEDCGDHGFCSSLTKGHCACKLGWSGDLCHIQTGLGVQLDRIRSGPLCDLSKRPCRKIFIDASNLDLSDDLVCAVTVTNAQGNETLSVQTTSADYLSAGRMACEILASEGDPSMIGMGPPAASSHYRVSASSDKLLFGNELSLHVFDGNCLRCDGSGCSVKSATCLINNVCYKDGAINPHNPAQNCDSTTSSTAWTTHSTTVPPTMKPMWVSISGPDNNLVMSCDLHDLGSKVTGHEVKVEWQMNGVTVMEDTLQPGTTTVHTHLTDIISGGTGKITCVATLDGVRAESGAIQIILKK